MHDSSSFICGILPWRFARFFKHRGLLKRNAEAIEQSLSAKVISMKNDLV
jgi:hypothetical protein